ncbi:lipopolysaccharide biosynthesis protein [Methylophaga sp.]|uniref:lipopolysaccharide biosynthesis protein n=1 Tax=Methylophaga sp. TaxID=2024840 RepID=UPI003A8F11DD
MTFLNHFTSNAVVRRLLHGVGANFAGKIWALIIQIVSVPVMSMTWGVDGFGVWLMISTIPTYLALSDFGLGVAAGVNLTAAMEQEDRETGLRVFQSVWCFLTIVTVSVGGLCIAGAAFWLSLSPLDTSGPFERVEIFKAICCIVAASLLTMQMSILKVVFQATHKYALGTAVFDLIYFIGSIFVLVTVLLGGSLWVAALVQFLTRIFGFYIFNALQKSYEPWCALGWRYANIETLKRLMSPSLSALSLTVANSFGLQGVVLTIGWVFGPATAATFATTRMLTRVPMQFSGLLTRASLPELTRSQVSKNSTLTTKLMKLNMGLTLSVMLPAALVLVVLGPLLISFVSHGEMEQTRTAFALLGLATTFCAIWTTLGTRLIAINRQSEFAFSALALYLACAVMPYVFFPNITPILITLALADGLIMLVTINRAKK